ncbi:DUF4136 domain-containing protein [Sphingosinicella sp. CPCC 101087]|uniref:DUF4136 domain-containing protein n=1 Tax=Sphingosinicella sp. CPCC 101087 TaxID=2497754 RepID=UPI00101D79B7|nr:DUF4136 domain-containing protein [Sphingosinicella sp. CPCC 101087]
MKQLAAVSTLLVALLLVGGCQTTDQGRGVQQGVSVTRFHLGQPIARGEIAVEAADPAEANSLEFSQQAASVARELRRLGWVVAPGNVNTEQVAVIRVAQGSRLAQRSRSGLSIGFGGGTGGYRSGVGVGLGATIPVGGPSSGEIVLTELSVRIQRRSDATIAWEGRARLEARGDAPLASSVAAVDRLAWALFSDFPGESGATILVR